MKCPTCGATVTGRTKRCPKCKTVLSRVPQVMDDQVRAMPVVSPPYAFKASRIAIIGGVLLLLNWFLTPWQSIALRGGFGYFLANMGEYNLAGVQSAFAVNGFLGFTFLVATILFYSLWLLPLAGGVTLLALFKDRRLVRVVAVMAWLGFACLLGFSFFRFWYHAQIETLITPSYFSWGYFISLLLLLWIGFSANFDCKRTAPES
jgi:hypothetical protein